MTSDKEVVTNGEVVELRDEARDWQNQFDTLVGLLAEIGVSVGYGEHGEVVLR